MCSSDKSTICAESCEKEVVLSRVLGRLAAWSSPYASESFLIVCSRLIMTAPLCRSWIYPLQHAHAKLRCLTCGAQSYTGMAGYSTLLCDLKRYCEVVARSHVYFQS